MSSHIEQDQQQLEELHNVYSDRAGSVGNAWCFLLFVFGGMLICIFSIGALCASSLYVFNVEQPSEYLRTYQVDKADSSRGVETVFVGDSSLGNAIDAEYFSEIANTKSINLALTRNFGFGSSYNMLKRVVANNDVKNVVLMVTHRTATKDVSMIGYLRTTNANLFSWSDLKHFNNEQLRELLVEFFFRFVNINVFRDLVTYYEITRIEGRTVAGEVEAYIKNDYVRQIKRLNTIGERTLRTPPRNSKQAIKKALNLENHAFLKRIITYCEEKGLNLIFVHGPQYDDYYNLRLKYHEDILFFENEFFKNEFSEVENFTAILDPPVLIPLRDLGNTINHIWPGVKKKYTKIYADLLRQHLKS